jgi:hypothetical protein
MFDTVRTFSELAKETLIPSFVLARAMDLRQQGSLDKPNGRCVRTVLRLANDERSVEQFQPFAGEHAHLDQLVVFDPPQPSGLDLALDDARH